MMILGIHTDKMNKNALLYKLAKKLYLFFLHMFYPYGYIRNYIIFPVKAFLRCKRIPLFYNRYKKLLEIKDKHKGKRCFIIATGPSLRWEDLDRLKDEVTFGMNSLYKGYSLSDFRPAYYMILDKGVFMDFDKEDLNISGLAKDAVFLNDMIKIRGDKILPVPFNYLDHWFNYGNPDYNYRKNLKYSDDLLWGFYDKYTTTIAAVEAAVYMGCREIYLLGADCNYAGKDLHFIKTEYDKEDWAPNKHKDAARIQQQSNMIGYEYLKKEARKRGVRILNATRGGQLDIFERIDFDSIQFKKGTCEDSLC